MTYCNDQTGKTVAGIKFFYTELWLNEQVRWDITGENAKSLKGKQARV